MSVRVDALREQRKYVTEGGMTRVIVPHADARNGRCVGWMGRTPEGWVVTVYDGPRAGRYSAVDEETAKSKLDAYTEEALR